jgi:hypothetical protein
MTARFVPSPYPGGRIVLRSGAVDVGAVFPPAGEGQHRYPWAWRFWGRGGTTTRDGAAKTELAAKNALLGAWLNYLQAAGLTETQTEEATNG